MTLATKNIRLYYLSTFLRSFFLLVSVNVMYYLAVGLSMTEVLLLASVLSIGIVLFEVPTGIFADKHGRKNSILISGLLLVVGYALLSFGASFAAFLVAMVMMAASMSFVSGADSALVYDSLADDDATFLYGRIESKLKTIALVGNALAALAGSYLYSLDIKFPYYAMVVLASLSLVCTMFMEEPPATSRERPERQTSMQYIKKSLALVKGDKSVLFLLVFEAIAFAVVNVSYRFFQPLMRQAGIPLVLFGLVYMVLMLLSALVVYLQPLIEHGLERRLGENATLWMTPIVMALAFVSLAGPLIFLFIGIFLVQLLLAYLVPLIKTKLQHMIMSKERATVLSIMGFLGNLVLLAISPLFGYLSDALSMNIALFVLAMVALISSFAALLWHGTTASHKATHKKAA